MFVLGTAGHVDHGKSTLVKALTGIDPDRLEEEQQRQLTIDLGFAWMDLPSGQEIGLVDVPGHRDFIENMLAGVGAIDAALFVVAADEGVMPQTREHLAILDLLGVDRGVVALTKSDLVQDPEWIELVEADVSQLVGQTGLAGAPIVHVSGATGEGLQALVRALDQVLGESEPRRDLGRPRLGVDRAFSVSGFGTVVTGTLLDGSLEVGEEIILLPSSLSGRIRGLQTHKQDRERVVPGTRVAANLSGLDVEDVQRGDVVAHPDTYQPTEMMDAHVRILELGEVQLEHNQQVKLFIGAAQTMARVRILGGPESIRPGERGWVQLLLEEAVVAQRGDRYILRRPSPPLTIAGGRVADPHPTRRHRMKETSVPARLEAILHGSAEELLLETLRAAGPLRPSDLFEAAGVPATEGRDTLGALTENAAAFELVDDMSERWAVDREWTEGITGRLTRALAEYHERYPLRPGMPKEELRSRLRLDERVFQALLGHLQQSGAVQWGDGWAALAEFEPTPSEEEIRRVETARERLQASPYAPPNVKEMRAELGEELYAYLRLKGELVQVSPDVVFHRDAYQSLVAGVEALVRQKGPVTVAQVRDHFDTSRKYVLGLLEHLDRKGVTVRQGDVRRLRGD